MLLAVAGSLAWAPAWAQPYVPGQSYFGRSNYIEYIAGDLPIIVSAPHGGTLTPSEIPDRDCTGISDCSTTTDSYLDDLAAKVRTEVQNRVGHVPHVIICRLKRTKVDCNREIDVGAMSNVWAMVAWNEFQDFIAAAKTAVSNQYGKGFYVDLHGHGHTIQRLELGYSAEFHPARLFRHHAQFDVLRKPEQPPHAVATVTADLSTIAPRHQQLRGFD